MSANVVALLSCLALTATSSVLALPAPAPIPHPGGPLSVESLHTFHCPGGIAELGLRNEPGLRTSITRFAVNGQVASADDIAAWQSLMDRVNEIESIQVRCDRRLLSLQIAGYEWGPDHSPIKVLISAFGGFENAHLGKVERTLR